MNKSPKTTIGKSINMFLGLVDLKLTRAAKPYFRDYTVYIPCQETIEAAKLAGLSVGDYIDAEHNKSGVTQDTIDQMNRLGVFEGQVERVCEIGPGSGRYLDKVLEICNPSYCEIYETATDWEQWLVQQYKLIAHPTDGKSLSHTPSESIDLIQAHKVMPGQPSLVMCRYFEEMARVARTGGKIVFDIVTEECLDDVMLKNWFETGAASKNSPDWSYPCLMPKQFAIDLLSRRGCDFVGSFIVSMKPGKTECMVFAKQ